MGFGTLQQIMQGKIRVEGEDFDRLQSLYDGAISSMDDQIGRFVRGLESRGLSKSTLVYFIGDHGEEFIDHGGLGHARSLYEELVHVPLIVEGPGVRPGLVLEKPVRSIDLAPTILESAGLRFPRPVEGGSIWGALSRGEVAPSPAIYMEETYTGERSAFHLFRSVRVGDLKLIGSSFFLQGGGPWRWELYDLASDPGERRDLASARPADVSRLRERIQLRVKLHERRRASAIRGDDSELRQQLHALGYIE
jgi:arylsulfatase A-like enzyme